MRLDDLERTVFIVLRPRDDGNLSVAIFTLAKELDAELIPGATVYGAGTYRQIWPSLDYAKSIIGALKALGYQVTVLRYAFIKRWASAVLDLFAKQSRVDSCDLGEISNFIPYKRVYVEVFGDCSPFLVVRNPSPIEVFNDLDNKVVNFFEVMRQADKFSLLFLLSRAFMNEQIGYSKLRDFVLYDSAGLDIILSSFAWFFHVRQIYTASSAQFDPVLSGDEELQPFVEVLQRFDPLFWDLHGRFFRVQTECNPWDKVVQQYDSDDTLFWVDLGSTYYDRIGDLRSVFDAVKGEVVLYRRNSSVSPKPAFKGWNRREFPSSTVWMKNAPFVAV